MIFKSTSRSKARQGRVQHLIQFTITKIFDKTIHWTIKNILRYICINTKSMLADKFQVRVGWYYLKIYAQPSLILQSKLAIRRFKSITIGRSSAAYNLNYLVIWELFWIPAVKYKWNCIKGYQVKLPNRIIFRIKSMYFPFVYRNKKKIASFTLKFVYFFKTKKEWKRFIKYVNLSWYAYVLNLSHL